MKSTTKLKTVKRKTVKRKVIDKRKTLVGWGKYTPKPAKQQPTSSDKKK